MTHLNEFPEGREYFEYHGNTAIERVRMHGGTVKRDWLHFNTTEEAVAYFNEQCACPSCMDC